MTRHDALFDLRYATRVLELSGSFWQMISIVVRFASFLSGTAAIAALAADNSPLTLLSGVIFAILQGIDFSMNPGDKAACRMSQRKIYAQILAEQNRLKDADLLYRLESARSEDDVIVSMQLRQVAYNQVVTEKGLSTSSLYNLNSLQKVIQAVC